MKVYQFVLEHRALTRTVGLMEFDREPSEEEVLRAVRGGATVELDRKVSSQWEPALLSVEAVTPEEFAIHFGKETAEKLKAKRTPGADHEA